MTAFETAALVVIIWVSVSLGAWFAAGNWIADHIRLVEDDQRRVASRPEADRAAQRRRDVSASARLQALVRPEAVAKRAEEL